MGRLRPSAPPAYPSGRSLGRGAILVGVSGDMDRIVAFRRMRFADDDSQTWVLNDPVDGQSRMVTSMAAFNEAREVREGLTVTTFSEGPRTDVNVGALGIAATAA
jgi:hypothetical protein